MFIFHLYTSQYPLYVWDYTHDSTVPLEHVAHWKHFMVNHPLTSRKEQKIIVQGSGTYLQKWDVKFEGNIIYRRNFISSRSSCVKASRRDPFMCCISPFKFFQSYPTQTLNKSSLDLWKKKKTKYETNMKKIQYFNNREKFVIQRSVNLLHTQRRQLSPFSQNRLGTKNPESNILQ